MNTATATKTETRDLIYKTCTTTSGRTLYVLSKNELVEIMNVSLSSFDNYLQLLNQVPDFLNHKKEIAINPNNFELFTGYTEYQMFVIRVINYFSKKKTLNRLYIRSGNEYYARKNRKVLTNEAKKFLSEENFNSLKNNHSNDDESFISLLTNFQ